ncbi:MAG TPA: hypothetical protein VF480_03335, partial [Verrucomicrobiae bacterium]
MQVFNHFRPLPSAVRHLILSLRFLPRWPVSAKQREDGSWTQAVQLSPFPISVFSVSAFQILAFV